MTTFYDEWLDLDGSVIVLDGRSWILRVERYTAKYPYAHVVTNVRLDPTIATRQSDHYNRIKADLGDDWSTDVLSAEPEFQSQVMQLAKEQL